MKHITIIAIASLSLIACQGPKGEPGQWYEKEVIVNPETLSPQEQAIKDVLEEENSYRQMMGQTMLTKGLSCVVSKFVSPAYPTTIYATQYNSNKVGTTKTAFTFTLDSYINQLESPVSDGMILMPEQFRMDPKHQSWYLMRCTGHIVVTETNYYNFELSADDGAILTVSGSQVVNIDGHHSIQTGQGTKMLRKGVHSFKLEYLQGQGSQALILKAGNELINPMYFVH